MSKNFELALTMRLRDLASRGVLAASRDMQSAVSKTAAATDNLTKAVTNYARKREAIAVLGIRSEHEIQREMQRTEAAYNRLAQSGELSFREQARAAEALKTKLRELNNEMGKYSLAQRAAGGMRAGASVVAGAAAGGYVLAKPVEQTMDYGMRLAHMANTAFTDRDTKGRIAGKRELNNAIVAAVRYGGGTRENAAETLDSIISSGALSTKDATSILPSLTRAATASGADPKELANIAVRAMQTFKIKAEDVPGILDMANSAGKAGGFELKDMAKWLPQQMAMAKLLGMGGKKDFATLAAWNQASVITSGTKDEAGNNLRDLLNEVNSQHFGLHLKKAGVQNPDDVFLKYQERGFNKVDATVDVMRQIIEHDEKYKALQAKLGAANTPEDKRGVLEAMTAQVQGTNIGKVFHNQQSLMGLIGMMNNQEYLKSTRGQTLAGEGNSIQSDFDVVSDEAGFKVQQAQNEKVFATNDAFEKLTPLVGSVADGFTSIARQYPMLTAATVAATAALTALAAAAGAATLTSAISGGKGALLGGVLAKGRGLLAGGGGLLTRAGGALLGGAEAVLGTTLGAVSASGAVGYGAGTLGYDHGLKGTDAGFNLGGTIATMMSWFGSKDAEQALQIELHMDGQQVATVIRKREDRNASRH